MLAESLAGLFAIEANDLVVTDPTGAVQVLGTDYEVTGNLRTGTASIRALRAYTAGVQLTVTRVTDRVQQAQLSPIVPLPAKKIETELDRRTLIEHEQDAALLALTARTLRLPKGETAAEYPAAAARKGMFAGFDPVTGAPGVYAGTGNVADAGQSLFSQTSLSGRAPLIRTVAAKGREIITPDDFGGKSGTAVLWAMDEAMARGMPLTLTDGDYTLPQTMVLTSGANLEIRGKARLMPAAVAFAGADLIQIGTTAQIASEVSIRGQGGIECSRLVNRAINVVWGNFGEIALRNILGAAINGIKIGDAAAAGSSYEMNTHGVRIFNTDLQNDPASVGIYYDRATDCFLSRATVVGYRKGVRTDSDCYSIDMDKVHPWGRPAHGAMTHAFEILGGSSTLEACYADTPYDLIGVGGDLYGFYFDGFGNMLTNSRVFMNTTYPGTDISTDNRVVCCQLNRELYMAISNFYAAGGTAGTKRFKSLLGGLLTTSFIRGLFDGGITFFGDATTRQENVPATFTLGSRFRGKVQIDQLLTLLGGLDASAVGSFIQTAGDLVRYGAPGTNRDIFLRSNLLNRWGIRASNGAEGGGDAGSDLFINSYDDAGAFKATLLQIVRSTGQVMLGAAGGAGTRVRLNSDTQTTSPGGGGAAALPATPTGYVTVNINGTDRRLPYY